MHSEVNGISITESRDSIQEIESEETLDSVRTKYTYSNGCVFIGILEDRKKTGYGTLTLPNGDIYEGNWVNDKLEGYSSHRYAARGEIYGNWINGQLIGKGRYSDPYGSIFEGEWTENNPSAYGVFKYSNGDEYKGYLKRGARNGHGVFLQQLEGNKIYANWDNDYISENPISPDIDWPEFSSIMKEIYNDIDRLNFKRYIQKIENPMLKRNIEDLEVDIKRCQGVYIIVDGSKYCGGLKDFVFEGKGLFISEAGINYYGDWKAGIKHGNGICIFSSGLVYIGEWNNDKMEGIGGVEYSNGSYYSGAFKNNKKEGKGICKDINDNIFDGYFKNDLPQGSGIITLSHGREIKGDLDQGMPSENKKNRDRCYCCNIH